MIRASSVALLAMIILVLPTKGGAQEERTLRVGIAAGFSRDLNDNMEGRRNAPQGQISLERTGLLTAARLDLMYSRSGGLRHDVACPDLGICPVVDGRTEVGGLVLSGLLRAPFARVTPYLIAGLGAYRLTTRVETTFSCTGVCPFADVEQTSIVGPTVEYHRTTNFGVSGGLGFAFDDVPLGPFVEARYHRLMGGGRDKAILPVVAGLRF